MSVPYSPDALDRIRAGASARELGWDDDTYRRRCTRHGLVPVGLPAEIRLIDDLRVQPDVVQPSNDAVALLDRSRLTLSRGLASVDLTERYVAMLECFVPFMAHQFVPRDRIATKIGVKPHSVSTRVGTLRKSLLRLSLILKGRTGAGGGGYQIIDAKTFQPVKVALHKSKSNGRTPP